MCFDSLTAGTFLYDRGWGRETTSFKLMHNTNYNHKTTKYFTVSSSDAQHTLDMISIVKAGVLTFFTQTHW